MSQHPCFSPAPSRPESRRDKPEQRVLDPGERRVIRMERVKRNEAGSRLHGTLGEKENRTELRKECFHEGRLNVPDGNKTENPEKYSTPNENGSEATKNVK